MRASRTFPPLQSLRAFEAVGRLRSFRRAGEELLIAQSAVSHHVRQVEDMLMRFSPLILAALASAATAQTPAPTPAPAQPGLSDLQGTVQGLQDQPPATATPAPAPTPAQPRATTQRRPTIGAPPLIQSEIAALNRVSARGRQLVARGRQLGERRGQPRVHLGRVEALGVGVERRVRVFLRRQHVVPRTQRPRDDYQTLQCVDQRHRLEEAAIAGAPIRVARRKLDRGVLAQRSVVAFERLHLC